MYYGADVAELRALARSCDQSANRVRTTALQLHTVLAGVSWWGPDAAQFWSNWRASHEPALSSVESTLRSAATALQRNAGQQEEASAASTGATAQR